MEKKNRIRLIMAAALVLLAVTGVVYADSIENPEVWAKLASLPTTIIVVLFVVYTSRLAREERAEDRKHRAEELAQWLNALERIENRFAEALDRR